MNVAMLSTLVAVLDRGSFAAAAQEVGCTPSAVSLQVKQLEAYFGQPLFDRSARTVKPTPFALEAAAAARDFSARFEALRARTQLTVSGRIRLGAIATVQADALPHALRLVRDRHPGLEVVVSLNDSDILLGELKAGRIDAAVLVRPQSGGSSRLAWQNLARQPFVMLAPADTQGDSPVELLQRLDLIRYDTALTGGRIAARYVRQVFPKASSTMDVRAIDAIVAMVSAGLGISVVPQPRKALLQAHGVREVSLGRKGPARQIALVRRSADTDNRNIDALADALATAYAN
jgi:DNA-binding transcriptional LysR family regulator